MTNTKDFIYEHFYQQQSLCLKVEELKLFYTLFELLNPQYHSKLGYTKFELFNICRSPTVSLTTLV